MSKCWVVDDRLLSFELFLPPVELANVPDGDPGGMSAERYDDVAVAAAAVVVVIVVVVGPTANAAFFFVVAALVFVVIAVVGAVRVAAVLVGDLERDRDRPSGLRDRDFLASRLLGKTA
jgi:hypothetical protein